MLFVVVLPREVLPLKSSTVLPASAVPSIVGVGLFVNSVVVVIDGVLGAVVSIVIANSSEGADSFPNASVAVTVRL